MDLPRRQPSPGHSDDFTTFSPFVHHPFPFSRSDWAFLVSSLDQYALTDALFFFRFSSFAFLVAIAKRLSSYSSGVRLSQNLSTLSLILGIRLWSFSKFALFLFEQKFLASSLFS